MGIEQRKERWSVKRGVSVSNARGREQLNFEVLRDNVLKEIRHPLGQTRDIPVWNPHKIVRDNRNKKIAHGDVNQPLSVGVRQEGGESRNIHDTSLREEDEDNLDILMQL